jgi:hypothetical protein
VFATHPDYAITLFHDQADILADPLLRQLFRDYDHAADDPRIDDLARRIVAATRHPHMRTTGPVTHLDPQAAELVARLTTCIRQRAPRKVGAWPDLKEATRPMSLSLPSRLCQVIDRPEGANTDRCRRAL